MKEQAHGAGADAEGAGSQPSYSRQLRVSRAGLSRFLLISRRVCHLETLPCVVRSSGQTGFSNTQSFWQAENINSFLMRLVGGSSVPGPWLSRAHILPSCTRDSFSEVLLGEGKSHSGSLLPAAAGTFRAVSPAFRDPINPEPHPWHSQENLFFLVLQDEG